MSRAPTISAQWDSNRSQDPGVILSPFAAGFHSSPLTAQKLQCANQDCTNVGTKKCSGCMSAKYCSRECQTQDWKNRHKLGCRHPTTESTWVGQLPDSWLNTIPLSPATLGTLLCPRLVYDQTQREDAVENPAIMSMASRPSLLGQLENHSPETDGSFGVCISGGQGAFVSLV
jgi:hypothetical protein